MNTRPLSLGIVPYLNMLPLVEGLERDFPEENWIRATPRELAGLLAAGEVDLAAVSTFEALRRGDEYSVVGGAAIGSDGPVRSVALYSKVPIERIRTIQLDRASLTSVHLLRVLAHDYLGLDPEYALSPEPLDPAMEWRHDPHDAYLAIGDTALAWEEAFPHRLDLGAAWKDMTGLPFVFAAWFVRRGLALRPEEAAALTEARRRGEQSVDAIVGRLSEKTAASHGGRESLRQYLGSAIRYRLGEREWQGLVAYKERLGAMGLLPRDLAMPRLVAQRDHEPTA